MTSPQKHTANSMRRPQHSRDARQQQLSSQEGDAPRLEDLTTEAEAYNPLATDDKDVLDHVLRV
jgi:hypothetical protein